MLEGAGKADDALAAYGKSLSIREPFAAEHPTDVDAIRDAAIAHEKVGNVLAAKGSWKEALESLRKSLGIFRQLVEADPQNAQARHSLALSYIHLGEVWDNPATPHPNRADEARKHYLLAREALGGIDVAGANVKTRETLQLIERKLAATRARP
jgi:tetratricopeptide (TPR) repeat protein